MSLLLPNRILRGSKCICRLFVVPSHRLSYSSSQRQQSSEPGHDVQTAQPPPSPYTAWGTRRKLVFGSLVVGGAYYLSHLERVPETGRWRYMNIKEADEEEISIELYKQLLKEHGPDIMASTNKHTWHIARILERILVSNDLGSLHHHTPTLSEPARRRWRLVFVCDPSVVNAMSALGTIVVFTGILPLGRDEDGLAAILAHEVGHIIARHSAEALSTAQVGFGLLSVLTFGLGWDFGLSQLIKHYMYELPNSRDVELEADAIGIRLLSRAGYRPEAMLEMLGRLGEFQTKAGTRVWNVDWPYTHPSSDTRVQALKALLPTAHKIQKDSGCSTNVAAADRQHHITQTS